MMAAMISQVNSWLSMRLVYDKLYTTREKKPPLKALILLTEYAPEELEQLILERRKLSKAYRVTIKKLETNLFRLHVEKEIWSRIILGEAIIDSSQKGCWIVYTDEKGYFVRHALEILFNGLYPDISRVYFNYMQIKGLLEAIKDAYKGSSIVTYMAIRRMHRRETERPRGTFLLWEVGAEDELKKQSEEYRIWIDHLSFEVKDEKKMILLQGSFTGKGLIRLRFGKFSDFQKSVLSLFLDLTVRWKEFFSERERRVEEGRIKLHPYVVKYPFEPGKSQIDELERSLSNFYSYSIIHGGNPYYVANLCDYQDGSSFGLTILGKTVTVTPMLRSTPYASWKLTDRIQRVIGEGEIGDIRASGAF